MTTRNNSIAQFNAAYLNYLLRSDEPLTDLDMAAAVEFASRHSGRALSAKTIARINTVRSRFTSDYAVNSARADKAFRAVSADRAAEAWHTLFLAACRIAA